MKANTRRKLIMSIGSAVMTVCCLTSTTYAWFARNSEGWTDEFQLEIKSDDGFAISIDGKDYGAFVSKEMINKAIVAKRNNINILEDLEAEEPKLTDEFIASEMKKLSLEPVATSNLVNFYGIDPYNHTGRFYNLKDADVLSKATEEDGTYSYVTFDLYFRVTSSIEALNTYDLMFISSNYIEEQRKMDNVCYSPYITAGAASVKVDTAFSSNGINYNAGDYINVNPADAMRIGVTKQDGNPVIYEPNLGIASYAIEGGEESYSPNNNPMLQYLNAYAKYDLAPLCTTVSTVYDDLELSSDAATYTSTEKNFDGEVSLARFTPTEDGNYEDIKLTFSIWLEGFDADYFAGIDVSNVSCYLSFCKKEVVVDEQG